MEGAVNLDDQVTYRILSEGNLAAAVLFKEKPDARQRPDAQSRRENDDLIIQ